MKQIQIPLLGVCLLSGCMIAGDASLGLGAQAPQATPNSFQSSGPSSNTQAEAKPTVPASISPSPSATSTTAPIVSQLAVTRVNMSSGDNLVINTGARAQLEAHVLYADNSRDSALSWSSSDSTVATINPTTGFVSGVKPGITTVTATSIKDSSKQARLTITVKAPDVVEAITRIVPTQAELRIGQTLQFQASIQLSDGTLSPNVIWRSANSSIAIVTNGLVTAVGPGSTQITAVAAGDSSKTAVASITVTE